MFESQSSIWLNVQNFYNNFSLLFIHSGLSAPSKVKKQCKNSRIKHNLICGHTFQTKHYLENNNKNS